MKQEQAKYLRDLGNDVLRLHEIVRKAVSMLRYISRNKKEVVAWRIRIEPIGKERRTFAYSYGVDIDIPKDMVTDDLKSLIQTVRDTAKQRITEVNFPKKEDFSRTK